METSKLCWGLLANFILADCELDYRNENISMKLLQQPRGSQQCCALVMPAMRHLLGSTDAAACGRGRRRWASPCTCAKARAWAYEDSWEAMELAWILVADPSKWKARFVGAVMGVLTINKRMGVPGSGTNLVWVTGDAMLGRVATVD